MFERIVGVDVRSVPGIVAFLQAASGYPVPAG